MKTCFIDLDKFQPARNFSKSMKLQKVKKIHFQHKKVDDDIEKLRKQPCAVVLALICLCRIC